MLSAEKRFSHLQKDSRPGLQMHKIPVTFSRVLAVGLGKFPPLLFARWDGFAAWERDGNGTRLSSPTEARCEISHGQTSESCGVPRRRGTEKMKGRGGSGGGEKAAARERERKKSPKQQHGLKSGAFSMGGL